MRRKAFAALAVATMIANTSMAQVDLGGAISGAINGATGGTQAAGSAATQAGAQAGNNGSVGGAIGGAINGAVNGNRGINPAAGVNANAGVNAMLASTPMGSIMAARHCRTAIKLGWAASAMIFATPFNKLTTVRCDCKTISIHRCSSMASDQVINCSMPMASL